MDKRTLRPIKKLLEIMLDNIFRLDTGLCALVKCLHRNGIISISETFELDRYIAENKPKTCYDRFYYWKIGNEKPRVKWLEKHIELNS